MAMARTEVRATRRGSSWVEVSKPLENVVYREESVKGERGRCLGDGDISKTIRRVS
jgi:hypothetical protein